MKVFFPYLRIPELPRFFFCDNVYKPLVPYPRLCHPYIIFRFLWPEAYCDKPSDVLTSTSSPISVLLDSEGLGSAFAWVWDTDVFRESLGKRKHGEGGGGEGGSNQGARARDGMRGMRGAWAQFVETRRGVWDGGV